MANKGDIVFSVRSSNLSNTWYRITRFLDYDITIDMDTDVDNFSFTIDNPDSIFTGLVSGFDVIKVKLGDKEILLGIVDSVEYSWSDSSSSISISGRDKACLLTDNDVNPMTKKNVKPTAFIKEQCSAVGIKYKNEKSIPTVKKLDISAGSTRMDAIHRAIEESHQDMWFLYDTLYTGKWNTNKEATWRFTRGMGTKTGVPILDLTLKEDYADTRSEIRIYSDNDGGKSVFCGSSKLPIVEKRGFKRISTEQKDDDTSKNKAQGTARDNLEELWRNAFELKIRVKNDKKYAFMPDCCCNVIDKYSGINGKFYIRAVRYTVSESDGHICELTLIPSDLLNKKLMSTGKIMRGLCSTNNTSLKMKLAKVLSKYNKKW